METVLLQGDSGFIPRVAARGQCCAAQTRLKRYLGRCAFILLKKKSISEANRMIKSSSMNLLYHIFLKLSTLVMGAFCLSDILVEDRVISSVCKDLLPKLKENVPAEGEGN